jgi:hypothetical protein
MRHKAPFGPETSRSEIDAGCRNRDTTVQHRQAGGQTPRKHPSSVLDEKTPISPKE